MNVVGPIEAKSYVGLTPDGKVVVSIGGALTTENYDGFSMSSFDMVEFVSEFAMALVYANVTYIKKISVRKMNGRGFVCDLEEEILRRAPKAVTERFDKEALAACKTVMIDCLNGVKDIIDKECEAILKERSAKKRR